jgi:L-fuconolactonase
MTRIDSHQHFWSFVPEHYSWIGPEMTALRRSFGPEDLAPELSRAGIDGTVLVEARAHLDETDRLLRIAHDTPFVRGVVGWLPIRDEQAPELIARYVARGGLCGVRHWVGPADDVESLFEPALGRGIALLTQADLTFDLMPWPPQLGPVSRFVDAHPAQRFVLDHLAKPYVARGELSPWREQLRELSRRPNVYCKLSGLTTEARRDAWTPEHLRPYLDAALEAFSPRRLLFGSDWPVCTLATGYARWLETIERWLEPLSAAERDRILGGTAIEAYRL